MAESRLLTNSTPQRVVVVRALRGLGDMLCFVPALRSLRAALPRAQIALVGLPSARPFVKRFRHYLDEWIEFPGFPGIPERPVAVRQLPSFWSRMHARNFDLALQMHGSGLVSNSFTFLLGARVTGGFYLPTLPCPDNLYFLPYPANEREVRRHLHLMEFLGAPLRGENLEFPLRPQDWDAFESISAAGSLREGEYVCVHAGAVDPRRRWAPAYFAAVADALAARGLEIVLTGSREEAPIVHEVAERMHASARVLTGQTDLGALAVLLSRARLLVSNDTGVSHLAAALRVPSVVVFVASDPDRWAPLNGRLHRAVGRPTSTVACQHCGDPLDHRCLRDGCTMLKSEANLSAAVPATPEQVIAETEQLLTEAEHVSA